jgi:hypothetical protein
MNGPPNCTVVVVVVVAAAAVIVVIVVVVAQLVNIQVTHKFYLLLNNVMMHFIIVFALSSSF